MYSNKTKSLKNSERNPTFIPEIFRNLYTRNITEFCFAQYRSIHWLTRRNEAIKLNKLLPVIDFAISCNPRAHALTSLLLQLFLFRQIFTETISDIGDNASEYLAPRWIERNVLKQPVMFERKGCSLIEPFSK